MKFEIDITVEELNTLITILATSFPNIHREKDIKTADKLLEEFRNIRKENFDYNESNNTWSPKE